MIDITPFEQKLTWLNEWMGKEIDLMGLPYGFKQYIMLDDLYRSLDMRKFHDYCVYKKYIQYKQSTQC